MVYQYAFKTKEILSLNEVVEFLNVISDERKKKINKFYFTKDKVHSLFAEVILRYALWERYGFSNINIKFNQSKYGKPYLVNHKEVYFNLSHSGNWVLCGIGDVQLGVDVEQVKEKALLIANTMYTKGENEFIFKQSPENRLNAFYKIWTLKESYVKNVGKGLNIPFDSFEFGVYDDDIRFYFQGEEKHSFLFYTWQLDEQHITALCVKNKAELMINENIKILSLEDLMKWKGV